MAEERIDIEVTDKVDANVAKKMNAIADGAERGANYVDKLKTALAAINTSGTDRLVSAMARADSAAARLLNAQVRLTGAQDQGAAAAAKLAVQQQKLATESARTDAALARAASATAAAEAAALRLAAAQQRVTGASAQAGSGFASLDHYLGTTGNTAARTRANMANLGAQIQDIGVSLAGGQNPFLVFIQQGSQISYIAGQMEGGFVGLAKAATGWIVVSKVVSTSAIENASANLAQATAAQTAAAAEAAKAVVLANVVLAQQALTAANLEVAAAEALQTSAATALTLATIGLSVNQTLAAAAATGDTVAQARLAAALEAHTIAAAQATLADANLAAAHLGAATAAQTLAAAQYEAATAGAAVTRSLSPLLVGIAAVVAIVGGLYLGFKSFSDHIATEAKPHLEEYAKSLGLTDKEMRKLSGSTVDANGKLKEHDALVLTMGDSWTGFKQTVAKGWGDLIAPFTATTGVFADAWGVLMNFMYMAFLGFYAAVRTLISTIGKIVVDVVKIAFNVIVGLVNGVTVAIQGVINLAISGINSLSGMANSVMGALGLSTVIPQLDTVNLGVDSLTQSMLKLDAIDIGWDFQKHLQEGAATIEGFSQAWNEAATAAAKARIAALAASIIENRGPGKKGPKEKVDHTAEKRALAVGIVNLKLDDELARMKLLKDAREVQQRMDQIEENLAQKKITLNATERASILAKVQAIQDYKYVQAESDRIYEAAVAPVRTYNASIQASTELLAQHAITQEQFNQEKVKASRILAEAQDPLFALKEAQDAAAASTNAFGVEVDRANYYETIRQALLAKGTVISTNYVAGTNAEVDALIRKNDQLRQQQFIQSQLGGVLNPILQQNQEVEGKAAVYAQLEALRQQDIINEDTYQQALHGLYVKYNEMRLSAASDFFGALAGITKNGTGVVGAISKAAAVAQAVIDGYVAAQKALASAPPPFNVIAAAAIGLKTGANVAGILSTNVGGFATGGQFMVDGKSGIDANNINMNVTKGERVTVETPAQQRANDGSGGGGPTVNANTKVVNLFDEASFIGAMDSEEGERVVMNIIRRNRTDVGSMVKA